LRLAEVVSDPVSVLKNDICSRGIENRVNDPVNALKSETCSTNAEEGPNEPDTVLARPLTSEPEKNSEPVKILDSEM